MGQKQRGSAEGQGSTGLREGPSTPFQRVPGALLPAGTELRQSPRTDPQEVLEEMTGSWANLNSFVTQTPQASGDPGAGDMDT